MPVLLRKQREHLACWACQYCITQVRKRSSFRIDLANVSACRLCNLRETCRRVNNSGSAYHKAELTLRRLLGCNLKRTERQHLPKEHYVGPESISAIDA